jgi:hypothetical protein
MSTPAPTLTVEEVQAELDAAADRLFMAKPDAEVVVNGHAAIIAAGSPGAEAPDVVAEFQTPDWGMVCVRATGEVFFVRSFGDVVEVLDQERHA